MQPPVCDANGENELRRRRKRQTIEIDDSDGELYDPDREELRVKVYSGLYVNEATDLDDDLGGDDYADEIVSSTCAMFHEVKYQRQTQQFPESVIFQSKCRLFRFRSNETNTATKSVA